jgi:hypothetical protein
MLQSKAGVVNKAFAPLIFPAHVACHIVNFRIRVITGVLEDDTAVIQVVGASQRGEHDAAMGRNAVFQPSLPSRSLGEDWRI